MDCHVNYNTVINTIEIEIVLYGLYFSANIFGSNVGQIHLSLPWEM